MFPIRISAVITDLWPWTRFDLYEMLLVANLANRNWWKKPWKMTETVAHGYPSDSIRWELSNEYQHDRVIVGFQKYLHSWALDKGSLSIGRVNSLFEKKTWKECQHDRVMVGFQISLHSWTLDKGSLSIGRVNSLWKKNWKECKSILDFYYRIVKENIFFAIFSFALFLLI